MDETESGIVILVRPSQSMKALSPIVVTELGIATFVKPEHPLNASLPIEVIVIGIEILVSEGQFAKAPPFIRVTE